MTRDRQRNECACMQNDENQFQYVQIQDYLGEASTRDGRIT